MYTTTHPDSIIEDDRTPEQVKIDTLHETATRTYAAIRADVDLSHDAVLKRLAQAYVTLTDQLAAVKASSEADTTARRSTLERKIFGIPAGGGASAMISYRDGLDRASKLEQATATKQIRQAYVSGDDLMVRALLATGYTTGWADVINAYEELEPGKTAELEELWDLHQKDNGGRPNLFHESFRFHAVPPAEIGSFTPYKIAELARG